MVKVHSKRYRSAIEKLGDGNHDWGEAIRVLLETPEAKFDESVEMALHLNVDPKQSDQMVRGIVQLPHGSGKKVTILAFTHRPEEALQAGATYAGIADLAQKITEGWLDFDVAVATTDAMKEINTLARILGPRGLMPNPKSGTVSDNLVECIDLLKKGRVEFKMDKGANVQLGIGKRSFGAEKLVENAEAALQAIVAIRPKDFRGRLVRTVTVSTTMSPGLRIRSSLFAKF
jgi:large subunit ribosomal protein L1